MAIHPYFTALIAFCVTILMISCLKPIAYKINLVDNPNDRKHHSGAIPLIGGIAISLSFCISILALDISLSSFRALLASFILLVIIGVMDDFHELSPRLRMCAQLIVGLFVTCWGHVILNNLGALTNPYMDLNIGLWGIPLTVIVMIALINANNMLDGLNGLAGGSSFITLACLCWIALQSHDHIDMQFLLILICAILGFLCFNFPVFQYRNRLVFLGDAGSTSLGLMMGWFAIKFSQPPYHFLKIAYLPWLLILPIFDLTTVTLRRIIIKRISPLAADREHIHHLLLSFGLRPSITTLCLLLLALVGGLIAIFMAQYQTSEPLALGLFIILFFIYFIYANFHWHKRKV